MLTGNLPVQEGPPINVRVFGFLGASSDVCELFTNSLLFPLFLLPCFDSFSTFLLFFFAFVLLVLIDVPFASGGFLTPVLGGCGFLGMFCQFLPVRQFVRM